MSAHDSSSSPESTASAWSRTAAAAAGTAESPTPLDIAFAEADTPIDALRRNRPARRQAVRVGRVEDLPPGSKTIVAHGVVSVGVFNVGGSFHAIKNVCPHYGAPLCRGHVGTTCRPVDGYEFATALEGRVVRCPWHGWEFDVVTGKALYDAHSRVATYTTEITAGGEVMVYI
ncbi:MAG: Rieske (2Fe-2S) protein [Planctomycetota bacterium]